MESKKVIILLANVDRLIEVPAGMSIMEAALHAGIKLIHSCLKGQSGSCRGDGQVDMRSNFSLFAEEVGEGQILSCQSYPIND